MAILQIEPTNAAALAVVSGALSSTNGTGERTRILSGLRQVTTGGEVFVPLVVEPAGHASLCQWAVPFLEKWSPTHAVAPLTYVMREGPNDGIKIWAAAELLKISPHDHEAVVFMLRALQQDQSSQAHFQAAWALWQATPQAPELVSQLAAIAEDPRDPGCGYAKAALRKTRRRMAELELRPTNHQPRPSSAP